MTANKTVFCLGGTWHHAVIICYHMITL